MNKEQIAEVISSDEDSTGRALSINATALEGLPIGTKLYAQLEKAPEPWGYAKKYIHELDGECWELCDRNESDISLFTSPPEVAELQPEIERLVALNDKLRANEQKLIDDKFELQRQVQALQTDADKSKEALAEAVKAIYFDDSSDFGSALWKIVLFLGGEEASDLLGYNEKSAYKKYVEGLVKS